MFDITRELHHDHPTWPGDPDMSLELVAAIARGDPVNVSRLSLSLHTGTHVDAPWHYDEGGARLDAVDLDLLNGACFVLQVRGPEPVMPETALGPLEAHGHALPPRVLIGTGQPDVWERFPSEFAPLTVELVDALADRGVRVIGTDAPSVDAFGDERLPVHAAFARRGLLVLEGLALSAVPAGRYLLRCLPLRLRGADASPVRALLLQHARERASRDT